MTDDEIDALDPLSLEDKERLFHDLCQVSSVLNRWLELFEHQVKRSMGDDYLFAKTTHLVASCCHIAEKDLEIAKAKENRGDK